MDNFSDELRLVSDLVPFLLFYVDAERRCGFANKAYADWFGLSPEEISGRYVWEVIGEAAYESVHAYLDTVLAGSQVRYEMRMPDAGGEICTVQTELIPDLGPDGQVRGFAGYVQDITERRLAEEKLQTVARQHAVLIAAQQEIADAGRDLTAALGSVVRRARQITGAGGAAVQLIEGGELVYRAASGTAEAFLGQPIRLRDSFSGRCVREGRTLHCPDVEAEPDLNQAVLQARHIRSMVVVPLQHRGQIVGVLQVSSPHPHVFDDDAISLLQLMVSMIVAAMSGAAEAEARTALSAGEARQRQFLRDVLLSVTDGCLHLCDGPGDLPEELTPFGSPCLVARDGSLAVLRHQVYDAAQAAGLPAERTHDLITAVGEAAMNAVTHAGQGVGRVSVTEGKVQVRIEDHGEGITVENLPKATLARGFSTKATLGHGFKMMLQTVDRIFLLTGRSGTSVVLEQEGRPSLPNW